MESMNGTLKIVSLRSVVITSHVEQMIMATRCTVATDMRSDKKMEPLMILTIQISTLILRSRIFSGASITMII